MKIGICALTGAALMAMASTTASAAVLVDTGFEAPGFVPGVLNGQSSFIADAPFNVVNNPANAFAGSQYVEANMATLAASGTSRFAWTDTPISNFNLVAGSQNTVRSSAMVRLGSSASTRQITAGIFLFADNGATLIGGIRLFNSNTTPALVLTNGAGVSTAFTGVAFDAWFELAIEANFATGALKYFISGTDVTTLNPAFVATHAATNFSDADLVATRGTGTATGGRIARFDNFKVEQIPAPSSLALLGLGGLAAIRRRR